MIKRLSLIGVLTGAALLAACGTQPASNAAQSQAAAPVQATPSPTPTPTPTPVPTSTPAPTPTPALAVTDWKSEVDKIAKSEKTTTQKFDEVTKLARAYKADEKELKEFETYIIDEFKSKRYLKDIKNDSYMLTNIFKSTVVERNYDDKKEVPIDAFAFDFLQNTKYTYRGADAVDSQSVKSNESQMNKSLQKMK